MNDVRDFGRVQKARFFSQKEAELLSSLTRNQLRKLDDIELVVPAKHPTILYSWNQLIFLRVLFRFSEDWSFKLLIEYFKLFSSKDLETLINRLDKCTSALLILEKNDEIYFQLLGEITLEDNDLVNQKLKKAIENIKNGEKLDFDDAFEIIKYIAYDALGENSSSKICFKKQTLIIIPEIIQEITSLALELEIKDFDLKVG
ncbi:hypothetical protein [Nostoc sp. 2RC]|uniref:hypothetical protein n=1 Tax=Nostoc sp. 2RC TaxID=2485484 RepID=UPI0016236986|nr:hypothetical protein [Nostoc sp. 2RC]MBC1238500.1 hypothetical protein [Nostoc sp. 2RC]